MVLTFDPFREFDRLADRMLNAPGVSGAAAVAMPMDLYRSGEHFVLHCDLAGIDPGSINVDVDGRVLTIRAERSARTDADVQWVRRERLTGTFERRITLGEGLDLAKIDATWNDGVLTVTIPVAETARPRRIEIATGRSPALAQQPQQATIEGDSTPAHDSTPARETTPAAVSAPAK